MDQEETMIENICQSISSVHLMTTRLDERLWALAGRVQALEARPLPEVWAGRPTHLESAVLHEGTVVIDLIVRMRDGVEALTALHDLRLTDVISQEEHEVLRADVIRSMHWRGE